MKLTADFPATRTPTEQMLNAARDWSDAKYGKPIGNDAAIGCWQAMFDARPAADAEHLRDLTVRALKLRLEYEAKPVDRGGKDGPKGKAHAAYIAARDARDNFAQEGGVVIADLSETDTLAASAVVDQDHAVLNMAALLRDERFMMQCDGSGAMLGVSKRSADALVAGKALADAIRSEIVRSRRHLAESTLTALDAWDEVARTKGGAL